ncbi:MAG: hypothetical protein JW795_23695 [Chitinivibrionales bacterium]|nr:hypothetical protein [Chitinivibrionales bacterium]
MRKKIYIETSVWNQLEHEDRPDWKETAQQFFATISAGHYEAYISSVVIDEILATTDQRLQQRLVQHINAASPIVLEMSDDAADLTRQYLAVEFGLSASLRIYRDCSHVAVATVAGIKHIVSFNCKHLVNDRRIDIFNATNIQNGYDHIVDISTPHKFLEIS